MIAPLFGYSLPATTKVIEDSYDFVRIQFDYVGQEIYHKDLTFRLLGDRVYIFSDHMGNNVPLSKKEWDNGEFYEHVTKVYKRSSIEFFDISYRDKSNIWAKITDKPVSVFLPESERSEHNGW